MKVQWMADGSVQIVETVADINAKYIAKGLPPPIVDFDGGPINEGMSIQTRMTAEEAKRRGLRDERST